MNRNVRFQIHGITVAYDGIPILDGFSLDINEGDFVAVLGPNGCGKTTLLRTLIGHLKPRLGAVLISDETDHATDVRRIAPRARAKIVASVRQDDETTFEFTVEDIVLMGRTPHLGRMNLLSERDRTAVLDAMRAADVLHLKDRMITELSGGERRRVMIARAIAQDPKVMLLDEPTANLDINYQHEMLSIMHHLNRDRGMTVVLVIHQINLAAAVARTMVLMNRSGKIHAAGTPKEVLTKENVEAVYGTKVLIIPHPISGKPQVVPAYDFDS